MVGILIKLMCFSNLILFFYYYFKVVFLLYVWFVGDEILREIDSIFIIKVIRSFRNKIIMCIVEDFLELIYSEVLCIILLCEY